MRQLGLFVDLPVLGLPKPTLRDAIQIAATINRTVGVRLLGQINLLLGNAGIQQGMDQGGNASARVQAMLVRDTVSHRRLEQLKDRLGKSATFSEWVIFHRRQVLASIKLVARYGQSSGGNKLESRDDLDVLADLALAVNSLNDFGPFPQQRAASLCELAAQIAPARELEDLPRIDNAFVRSRRMLGDFLRAHQTSELARHLEHLFVFLTRGFSFEAYRDMTFGLLAYCNSLSTTSMTDFQSRAFFNPDGPTSMFSGPLFAAYLSNLAVDIDALPSVIESVRDERHLLLDHTVFRMYPVWRVDSGHYLCIDPYFLVDKLASGLYWAINQALARDSQESTRSFSGLWGRLVEDHVLDILSYAVEPTPARLFKNPHYEKPYEEAFDAAILDGRHAVVFQVKGLFAKADLKYSGRGRPFFRGLSEKFGNQPGAATQQLVRNIRLTFGLPRPRKLKDAVLDDIRCVWPVVVALDPILDFELSSRMLVERFERRIARVVPRADTAIRPVVFMQVEDVEMLADHIRDGDFTLVDCLREKLGEDRDHNQTFGDFFRQHFRPAHGLPFKRNAAIAKAFEEIGEETRTRFGSGVYKECVETEYGTVFRRPRS